MSMLMLHAYPRFLTADTKKLQKAAPGKVDYFYKNAARLREEGTREAVLDLLAKVGGRAFRNYRPKERGQFHQLMLDVGQRPLQTASLSVPTGFRPDRRAPWGVALDHERFWFGNKIMLSNARRRSFGKSPLRTDFEFHPKI